MKRDSEEKKNTENLTMNLSIFTRLPIF